MSPILQVLLPLPLPPFDFLPMHGAALPEVGQRVVVPWQQSLRIGIVVGIAQERGRLAGELREVISTLDTGPFLSPAALATLQRVADYTLAPAGTVLADLLPIGLSETLSHEVRALPGVTGVPIGTEWLPALELKPGQLELCRRQGLIEERVSVLQPTATRLIACRDADAELSPKQRQALAALQALGPALSAAAVAREAVVSEGVVRALITKGYARYWQVEAEPPALPSYSGAALEPVPPIPPEAICLSGGRRRERLAALIPRLAATVAAGGSALVLVPEQALIAETAGGLATQLPVAVLSGELNDAQRRRLWLELPSYTAVVLVGTYLALLAPLRNLQQVVVLEAASPSYKLASGCRAFVPTAARFRAEASSAALLESEALASAEMWVRSAGRRHELPRPEPRLHVVDLNGQANWPLSADLIKLLKQVAERERQAVLLAPRRGFSAGLSCQDCGYLATCSHCDLPLRYHRDGYRLRCHQCGFSAELPPNCPQCNGHRLHPARAAGTQWIQSAIKELLPGFNCWRFDSDQRDNLSSLQNGQPGVVVGTSALLRQPPLPNVSLLAVTLLDTLLYLGDYRGEEETLRLLFNLAELTESRRPLTVIQTFQADHPLLQALQRPMLLDALMNELLERRRRFGYPPFTRLAKVQVLAKERAAAERVANWLASAMRTLGAELSELLGPAPALRLKGLYTVQLLVRAADEDRLRTLLVAAREYRGEARVRFEVDPRDIGYLIE
ncbi:MAG: primosomal protein N' [Truepera sp.]|nr:primosomal protein N' [Truepera sp.]